MNSLNRMDAKQLFRCITLAFFLTLLGYQPVRVAAQNSGKTLSKQSATVPSDSTKWSAPEYNERQGERDQLVNIIKSDAISDPDVLKAMQSVPRHLFVPDKNRHAAYKNIPLPIGYGQTISQPTIVAFMTEMLELTPGDKVLEIGTGSGYQAAVLAHITPEVYTMEIIEDLADKTSKKLKKTGYDVIRTKPGDGYYGWEKHAPFDAIIVTAAAGHIPPPLIKQLKPGGIMAIPLGSPYEVQTLVRVRKTKSGEMKTERLMPVRFVPMTGAVQK